MPIVKLVRTALATFSVLGHHGASMQYDGRDLPICDWEQFQGDNGCRARRGASQNKATTPSLEAAEGELARGKRRANRVRKSRAVISALLACESVELLRRKAAKRMEDWTTNMRLEGCD